VANEKSPALTAGPGRRVDFGRTANDGDLMNKMLRRLLQLERLGGEKYGSADCGVTFVAAFSYDLAHPEGLPRCLMHCGICSTVRISHL
jgi:hypothetical protein